MRASSRAIVLITCRAVCLLQFALFSLAENPPYTTRPSRPLPRCQCTRAHQPYLHLASEVVRLGPALVVPVPAGEWRAGERRAGERRMGVRAAVSPLLSPLHSHVERADRQTDKTSKQAGVQTATNAHGSTAAFSARLSAPHTDSGRESGRHVHRNALIGGRLTQGVA